MKKIFSFITLIILLNSCESVEKGLGMKKDTPDEFLIEKRNPLVIPPNFDLLPPDSVIQDSKKDERDILKEIFNNNLDNKKNAELNKKENSSGSSEKTILDKIRK
jgi:hypothetical protein